MVDEIPFAKLYKPSPYWGCPHCGANCFGAIDPFADEYIYRCHGTQVGFMQYPGCDKLFRLPPEAHSQFEEELIAEGFEVADD